MHAQLKTQRASIVPLLMAADKAVKAKDLVDDELEECRAAVMGDYDPKAVFTGLGNEIFSPVYKPLKCGPMEYINYADLIVRDNLEGLDPDHKETIQ